MGSTEAIIAVISLVGFVVAWMIHQTNNLLRELIDRSREEWGQK